MYTCVVVVLQRHVICFLLLDQLILRVRALFETLWTCGKFCFSILVLWSSVVSAAEGKVGRCARSRTSSAGLNAWPSITHLGLLVTFLQVRDILEEVEIEIIKNSLMKVRQGAASCNWPVMVGLLLDATRRPDVGFGLGIVPPLVLFLAEDFPNGVSTSWRVCLV